jgi:hypothetical protein
MLSSWHTPVLFLQLPVRVNSLQENDVILKYIWYGADIIFEFDDQDPLVWSVGMGKIINHIVAVHCRNNQLKSQLAVHPQPIVLGLIPFDHAVVHAQQPNATVCRLSIQCIYG